MQADFREERRLALMNKPVIETGSRLLPSSRQVSPAGGWRELDSLRRRHPLAVLPAVRRGGKIYLVLQSRSSRIRRSDDFGLRTAEPVEELSRQACWKTADGYRAKLTPKTSSLRKAVSEFQVDISNELSAKRLEIVGSGRRPHAHYLLQRTQSRTCRPRTSNSGRQKASASRSP